MMLRDITLYIQMLVYGPGHLSRRPYQVGIKDGHESRSVIWCEVYPYGIGPVVLQVVSVLRKMGMSSCRVRYMYSILAIMTMAMFNMQSKLNKSESKVFPTPSSKVKFVSSR